ncbi:rCG58757 [Rattus norvegicus]|uniref:RCG58757 n=1 Tax=Rattus norvegicus TaxID=10116 RepID=A6JLE0_RAT|nr:rCG58757 [Rattus norvegicus]
MQDRETEGMSIKLHLSCCCVNQGLQSTQTAPELIWKPRQSFTF